MKKIILFFILVTNVFYGQQGTYKYGFIDIKTGKEITPLKYDKIRSFKNGMAVVELEGKFGVINREGKEIIPVKYDYIFSYKDMIVVENQGKYGAFDLCGTAISSVIYNQISYIYDSLPLYVVSLEGKYGLVNEKFEKITALIYDDIFRIRGAISVKINGKYGFLNQIGEETTEIKYDQIGYVVNIGKISLTPARIDNKWSFFNNEGKEAFQIQYDFYEASDFSSDLYKMMKVRNDNKWGCINENLIEVVPPKYDEIYFEQLSRDLNVITVKLNNKWGVFDMLGNQLVAVECDEIDVKYSGFIFFKMNGKWGVKDTSGKEILTARYQKIEFLYHNDLFAFKINNKWGVVSGADQIVIPAKYDESFLFSPVDSKITGILKNMTIVFDEKGNIISKKKKIVYKGGYLRDYCGFSDGNFNRDDRLEQEKKEQKTSDLIKVKINDKWMLIDNEGNKVTLPIESDSRAHFYREGIATVKVRID